MTLHSTLTGTSMHVLHAYTWANAAARTAFVAVAGDVGKMGYQSDTKTFYMIEDSGPTLLQEIGAGGGGGSGADLVYELDTLVASIRAAETIAANDAVALAEFDQDGFLVVKADCDFDRYNRSFIGFAKAAATSTQGDYTLDFTATTIVAGNPVKFDLNGQSYSVDFNTDHDTTVADVATVIQNHPDVQSATVNVVGGINNDTITILSGNGQGQAGSVTILIDNVEYNGAPKADPADYSFTTNVAAAGDPVDIHRIGALAGFAGLNTGDILYLSDTAGALTTTPSTPQCSLVGYALDANTVLVEPKQFPQPSGFQFMYRSHGGSTGNTDANNQKDQEIYNFTSWSSGVDAPTERAGIGNGDQEYNGKIRVAGGYDTVGTAQTSFYSFSASTWNTDAVLPGARNSGATAILGGLFYYMKGSANVAAGAQRELYKWDDASWTSGFADDVGGARAWVNAGFSEGGFIRTVNGDDEVAASVTEHRKFNGSTWSADTTVGASRNYNSGRDANGGLITAGTGAASWDGATWITGLTLVVDHNLGLGSGDGNLGGCSAFDSSSTHINGGTSAAAVSITSTDRFNGSSFSAGTNSTNARAGSVAGVL